MESEVAKLKRFVDFLDEDGIGFYEYSYVEQDLSIVSNVDYLIEQFVKDEVIRSQNANL